MLSKEQRISAAMQDISAKRTSSIREAAAAYSVPYSTLQNRCQGRKSVQQHHSNQGRLTAAEELVLVQRVKDLQSREMLVTMPKVLAIAQLYLQERDDLRPLGKHWAERFMHRHGLSTSRSKSLAQSRLEVSADAATNYRFADDVSKTSREPESIEAFVQDLVRYAGDCDMSDLDSQIQRSESMAMTSPTMKDPMSATVISSQREEQRAVVAEKRRRAVGRDAKPVPSREGGALAKNSTGTVRFKSTRRDERKRCIPAPPLQTQKLHIIKDG